jgi:hypothetical protein
MALHGGGPPDLVWVAQSAGSDTRSALKSSNGRCARGAYGQTRKHTGGWYGKEPARAKELYFGDCEGALLETKGGRRQAGRWTRVNCFAHNTQHTALQPRTRTNCCPGISRLLSLGAWPAATKGAPRSLRTYNPIQLIYFTSHCALLLLARAVQHVVQDAKPQGDPPHVAQRHRF